MTGATFGRRGSEDADMARRRAAFLAEERARRYAESDGEETSTPGATSSETKYVHQRSLGLAYFLWFLLGGVSAHRFYLGYFQSAMIQAGICMGGVALLLSGLVSVAGGQIMLSLFMIAFGVLWVLGDAFLIPGMHATANANSKFGKRTTAYSYS